MAVHYEVRNAHSNEYWCVIFLQLTVFGRTGASGVVAVLHVEKVLGPVLAARLKNSTEDDHVVAGIPSQKIAKNENAQVHVVIWDCT